MLIYVLKYLTWLNNSFPRFPDCDEPYPRPVDLLPGSDPTNQSSMTVQRDYGFWCPRELKIDPDLGYTFMGRKDCSAPCPSMFFNQQELTFIRYFIGVISIVCLSATLFTFLTFLIDVTRFEWLNLLTYWVWSLSKLILFNLLFSFLIYFFYSIRFRYPERPIIFYAVCYVMVSLVFFLGFLLEDRVACNAVSPAQFRASTITQGSHNKVKALVHTHQVSPQ